jgi:peroxiredoxin
MSDNLAAPSNVYTKGDRWFLLILLAASLCLNVFLGLKVNRAGKGRDRRPEPAAQIIGTTVESIAMSDLSNQPTTLTLTGTSSPTVLYVFSPACSWCERNLENIKTLANAKGDAFRFVGISLVDGNLEKYKAQRRLNFQVFKGVSAEDFRKLGLGSTPQTIVISPEGKILKNWVGAFGDTKEDVEDFFKLKLPGLGEHTNAGAKAETSCNYCQQNGLTYSLGALTAIGDLRMRCRKDRKWHEL